MLKQILLHSPTDCLLYTPRPKSGLEVVGLGLQVSGKVAIFNAIIITTSLINAIIIIVAVVIVIIIIITIIITLK